MKESSGPLKSSCLLFLFVLVHNNFNILKWRRLLESWPLTRPLRYFVSSPTYPWKNWSHLNDILKNRSAWLNHTFFNTSCDRIVIYVSTIPWNSALIFRMAPHLIWASQVVLVVKNLPANAGDARDLGSIPGSGRSPGGGNGNPLQHSCRENSMDREAWRATVHGVSKSQTRLKQLSTHNIK